MPDRLRMLDLQILLVSTSLCTHIPAMCFLYLISPVMSMLLLHERFCMCLLWRAVPSVEETSILINNSLNMAQTSLTEYYGLLFFFVKYFAKLSFEIGNL